LAMAMGNGTTAGVAGHVGLEPPGAAARAKAQARGAAMAPRGGGRPPPTPGVAGHVGLEPPGAAARAKAQARGAVMAPRGGGRPPPPPAEVYAAPITEEPPTTALQAEMLVAEDRARALMEDDFNFMQELAYSVAVEDEQAIERLLELGGAGLPPGLAQQHVLRSSSPPRTPPAPRPQRGEVPQAQGLDHLLLLSTLPVSEWLGKCGSSDCSECPLCLCDYAVGERIMRLPCLHSGHEECLAKCLARRMQCPVCKLDIRETILAANMDTE